MSFEWLQNLRFENPELLWVFLILPIIFLLRGSRGRSASLSFSSISLAKQVSAFVRSRPGRLSSYLRLLGVSFLIVALARPQLGSEFSEVESSGIDIVLAVDLSGSMHAHDFEDEGSPVSRLHIVKRVIDGFVEERKNDRIGLIAFGTDPYLVSPLTLNHEWLRKNLKRLDFKLIDGNSTAISSAIAMSANRLRNQKAKSRVVVLLTDGAHNSGSVTPVAAAEAVAALGIKVYTIGVGAEDKAFYPFMDDNGDYVRDRLGRLRGRYQPTDLDMESLDKIAEITSGKSFRATDTEELEGIYAEIDELEKTEIKLNIRSLYSEAFHWPALIGLIFLLLETLLNNTIYRRVP